MTQNDVTKAIELESDSLIQPSKYLDDTPSKTVVIMDKQCDVTTSDLEDQPSNSSVS